jgi:DNA-directed RNA polymerase specialized sigma24 family protein
MANKDLVTEEHKPHRILREVFRNFRQFRELVAATGTDVIEHGYFVYNEDGTIKKKVSITISYSDLLGSLNKLSDRKREAVVYNVIMDMKQRDVAAIMKITTVSVGQYVDTGMEQLADDYFATHKISEEEPGVLAER